MSASKLIGNLLNVRANEYAHTMRMLLHAFFSGLGIALAFTGINVLLIQQHGSHYLPQIYLWSCIVLLATGYVYSKLEHRMAPGRLFVLMLLVSSAWSFITAYLLGSAPSLTMIMAMYCGYFVLYLLNNLEFWGAAALLYDVRQGKRLFGLLSSGESLAKIIGYAITPLIVRYFDLQNLLSASAIAFGISAWFIYRIVKLHGANFDIGHHNKHPSNHHQSEQITHIKPLAFVKRITGDQFNRNIALFALLSTLVYYTIHYAFLEKVEERYASEEDIAVFFGTFFTIAKFLNLLMKGFLSGRLLNSLGIRIMIMILPMSLLLINLTGLGAYLLGTGGMFLLFVFGANMMADEIFRTSLHKPSYLVLFQPFAKNKRLEGHTMTKGIMEPLGMGLAGLILWLLVDFRAFTLENLVMYSSVIAGVWVISTFQTTRTYKTVLNDALKKRLIGQHNYHVSKEEIDLLIGKKLHSSDPAEQLYALRLGGPYMEALEKQSVLSELIRNTEPKICQEALLLIREMKISSLADEVLSLARHSGEDALRLNAISCYSALLESDSVDALYTYFIRENSPLSHQAISEILKHGGLYGATRVGEMLLQMVHSSESQERIQACQIIRQVGKSDYYPILQPLLHDKDPKVVQHAILACEKVQHPKLIEILLNKLGEPFLYSVVRKALLGYGKSSIVSLKNKLQGLDLRQENGQKQGKYLLSIAADTGSEEATRLLSEYLNHESESIRTQSITGISKLPQSGDRAMSGKILKALKTELDHVHKLRELYSQCQNAKSKSCLSNEINASLRRSLHLLSVKYNNQRIHTLGDHLLRGDSKSKSVALELLENSLNMFDSRKYVHLFENSTSMNENGLNDAEELAQLLGYFIRSGKNGLIQHWSLAFICRLLKEQSGKLPDGMEEQLRSYQAVIIEEELNRKIKHGTHH